MSPAGKIGIAIFIFILVVGTLAVGINMVHKISADELRAQTEIGQ